MVGRSLGKQRQLFARFVAHADAGLAAEGDETFEAVVGAFVSYLNMIEAALAGLERFLDRVQPVENFHEG